MALTLLFREFKKNCNIENAIIDYQRKENKISIFNYCLEKDIDIKKKEIVCYVRTINMDFPTTCAMGSQTGSCPKKKE